MCTRPAPGVAPCLGGRSGSRAGPRGGGPGRRASPATGRVFLPGAGAGTRAVSRSGVRGSFAPGAAEVLWFERRERRARERERAPDRAISHAQQATAVRLSMVVATIDHDWRSPFSSPGTTSLPSFYSWHSKKLGLGLAPFDPGISPFFFSLGHRNTTGEIIISHLDSAKSQSGKTSRGTFPAAFFGCPAP